MRKDSLRAGTQGSGEENAQAQGARLSQGGKRKPRARSKRVWASVERDPGEVTDEIFQEARRRDPEKRRDWVMLVDGHKDQLKNIRAGMKRDAHLFAQRQ